MAYGAYQKYGTVPAAPNPLVPANPVHEVPDAYRPDYLPLHDTRGAGEAPSLEHTWDDYDPGPKDIGVYGRAEAELGTVNRNRDTQIHADRPVNAETWATHEVDEWGPAIPGYPQNGIKAIVENRAIPYYYDDLDVPGGFLVERRGSDIEPTERAYKGGNAFIPGANSIPANNITYDRWRHDDLIPVDVFGPPIQHGTEVIVTVDRPMQQPYGGNLVEGLKMYPHPAGDNILQAPIAPSQFPDRAMEPGVDPYLPGYLPGAGYYRDTSRAVYADPATDVTTQAFAVPIPAGAPSYDQSWE